MKPYIAYKDSGDLLLGEVPGHWTISKLKRVTQFLYGDSLSKDDRADGSVPVYGSNGITGYHDSAITKAPCIVIGRKGSYGKVNYSPVRCFPIDTTFFVDSTATSNDLRWLYYLLQSLQLDAFSKDSAVPGLNREEAYERITPFPPVEEQRAIAHYLDRKTAAVDTLIAKKERQIQLLQEQRAAVINQAVTRGLNADAPMKDSGIEPVGQIPAHWEVKRNKWIFDLVDERSESGSEELLSVSHLTGVTPRSEKNVNMFLAESLEGYKLTQPGDLVINTMWAWMGAVGISKYVGLVSPSYHVYRLKESYHPKYLDWFYRTPGYICEMTRFSKGIWSSRLRLYPEAFFEMLTPCPPYQEQEEIVSYLNELLPKMDQQADRFTLLTEKLKEYRTAIISAAVTGKIDVRNEVKEANIA